MLVNLRQTATLFVFFGMSAAFAQVPSVPLRNVPEQPAAPTEVVPEFPKHEVRAVWLTTVAGLDWPKSLERGEQQSTLRAMIAQVKAANLNTIFFQVRGRGDAMYRSRFEPWSNQLSGVLGQDPGWDPLQFVLDEAHARGLEVHAWFNTFFVRAGSKPPMSWPPHLLLKHPDWVRQYENEWWLDPGLPEVRAYLVNVVMDIVRSYDIDGIHFDFIRYPGTGYPDHQSYLRYGKRKMKEEWRRENINTFVRTAYDSIIAVKPNLKVGSTPIGIYVNMPEANGWQSFHTVFQDSRTWLREGKHDYLAPQVYWTLGTTKGDPDFAVLARDWAQNGFGRHVYIGIGAYKSGVVQQIPQLIDVSRSVGAQGNSFFRFTHMNNFATVGDRYRYPALIPSMPWKDSIPPNPPETFSVIDLGHGRFHLRWTHSTPAPDGDGAKKYVIYRSLSQPVDVSHPSRIVAIAAGKDTSFVDEAPKEAAVRFYYALTALDKGNNESAPTHEESAVISEIAAFARNFSLTTGLGEFLNHPQDSVVFVPYVLSEHVPVWLKVVDETGRTVQILVEGMQEPGKHVAAVSTSRLPAGVYHVQLTAGSAFMTRPIAVRD